MMMALLCSPSSAAEPGAAQLSWTSYLHDGPGKQFRTEDELDAGTWVQVLSCDGDWCRVLSHGHPGYLSADVIKGPAAGGEPGSAAPDIACFDARRAGYEQGKVFVYCPG
jgi:hypothetical protein